MNEKMHNQLDNLINVVKNNHKSILIAGAVAGTAALGFYGLKKMHHSNELKLITDKNFS